MEQNRIGRTCRTDKIEKLPPVTEVRPFKRMSVLLNTELSHDTKIILLFQNTWTSDMTRR